MKLLSAALSMVLTLVTAPQNSRAGLPAAEKDTTGAGGSNTSGRVAEVTPNDVLSIKNGRFFLDGEPFAEISFNKFDLVWQLYDQLAAGKDLSAGNRLVQAQDKALRNLHELGFKTIRIFALPWGPEGPASYAEPA